MSSAHVELRASASARARRRWAEGSAADRTPDLYPGIFTALRIAFATSKQRPRSIGSVDIGRATGARC